MEMPKIGLKTVDMRSKCSASQRWLLLMSLGSWLITSLSLAPSSSILAALAASSSSAFPTGVSPQGSLGLNLELLCMFAEQMLYNTANTSVTNGKNGVEESPFSVH